MRHLILIPGLLLTAQFSIANEIQLPLKNWQCKCDDHIECPIETIEKQSVINIPNNCKLVTSYTKNHDAAASLEVITLENPKFKDSMWISSDENQFKLYKPGKEISHQSNRNHTVTGYANFEKLKKITLSVANTTGQPLHIVDALLHTSKTPRSGSILIGHGGSTTATFEKGSLDNKAWIPLPLDYENQVPLDVHFTITPKSLVQSIHYEVDDLGNWGAVIQFNSNIADGTSLQFTWTATVLTNDGHKNRFKTPEKTNEWLDPSIIVQADNPAIASQAQTFLDPNSKINTVANIVAWLENNIHANVANSYDALTAFNSHETMCTGYANLAAAFGRALNIPSITLAGYLVGQSQDTHWINQFYLGDAEGWIRVEPQKQTNIEPEYFIPVRIDRLNEEIKSDFIFGISSKAFPYIPADLHRPDGNVLDADNLVEFTEPQDNMDSVFKKARKAWKKDFQNLLAKGNISINRLQIRARMQHVKSLKELDELLDQLTGA